MSLSAWLDHLLGLEVKPIDLTFGQMTARTLVVFVWGVLIVRWGDRRLLGRNAGFDMLVLIVLGSVLSRAVNGQAAFFPTLGVSAMLVFIHHFFSVATCRSHWLSRLVKGSSATLVRDGKIDRTQLRKAAMSQDDLEENLRINGNVARPGEVEEARLERNGAVSVVKKADRR